MRPHGTIGVAARLFRWDVFGILSRFDLKLSASADVAARYFDAGVGVGVWH